jgi:hypothetical protein
MAKKIKKPSHRSIFLSRAVNFNLEEIARNCNVDCPKIPKKIRRELQKLFSLGWQMAAINDETVRKVKAIETGSPGV